MSSKRERLTMSSVVCQAAAFLLCLGCLIGVHAQTSTVGSINGTVRDEKGAAVAGAEVIIQETQTGAARTVITDSDGFYSAPSLPVGRYTISTSPQGFKKTINSGVDLHVGDRLVVNLDVEVGQVSETVTVTGETQQVETRSGDVSSLVSEKQVTELPLNGRNYAALVLMVPGASPTNGAGGGATNVRGTGLDSHVDLSVNGNQSNANMWTVDGVNNMDVGSNATLLVFPSIDSIKEFKVERNSFSAEYGQAQGAVINLVTKGGGNEFHGTGFEFLRNDALNASDYFLNAAGRFPDGTPKAPKGKLRYNNYGFNFNGPIVLPTFGAGSGKFKKLTNRAFFFWSEEWRRERRGTALPVQLVPTAAERVGDFSGQLTDARPRDPFLPGRCDPKGTPGGVFTACFPGDIIPANRLSPAALALLKVYPLPNTNQAGGNWIAAPLEPVSTRQDLIRGDVTITQKMNLMVRYINETWTHGQAAGNFWGDTPFPTVSSDWDQPSNSFAVKLTNTLSSSAVNEFQFSRAGNDIIVTTSPSGQALNQEITSKFPTVFPHPGASYPSLVWGTDGYTTLWHQAPWMNHEDLFIWKDDFSKVWGNHDLKIGGLLSHNIKNEQIQGNNGLYFIQNSNSRTGNAIAEILLKDLPITEYSEIDNQGLTPGRWRDSEAYFNDTWKFSPHVTFTLGMRYSIYAPAYADNNRITNFIPRLFNGTDFRTALVQAGTNGLSRSLVNTYHGGWQPRLGLAWDIFGNGRTALRMGAGRYMGRSNVIEDVLRMAQNPPWTTTVDTGWQGSSLTMNDAPCHANQNDLTSPIICRSLDTIGSGLRNQVAGVSPTSAFNAVSENFRPPDSWQWNLTISREIMKNTVAEVSYVGNHGLHLWRRAIPFNDVVPSARQRIAQDLRNNVTTDPNFISANRRLPGLGRITMSESTGDSHYHALQVWVDRRFTQRLAFQTAYTWGHVISNVPLESFTNATTDPFNYDLDRGDADLDRRQSFVGNAVYVLPSFKRWGSVANKVLGDWQLNGIVSLFSGVPLNITSGANTLGLESGASTQRPNLVPGVPIYLHTSDPTQYLNPAAFALPAAGQNGTLGRGVIRSPGIKNVDFSINKNWQVIERVHLQFRAEMFNIFNHTNFNGVNTALNFGNDATDPANLGKVHGTFGRLSGDRGPREIQFGFKFSF